jgi:glutamate synthase (NADPH) GltB2 subunit (EC 1.4.1.13)
MLDEQGVKDISLIITGGLRVSSDFAKALALGADAIAISTAAMIACGCEQYRMCHTGTCPTGIATQKSEFRQRLQIDTAAQRVEKYLRVCTDELKSFARLTGNTDVHGLGIHDLLTTNSEISAHTSVRHV